MGGVPAFLGSNMSNPMYGAYFSESPILKDNKKKAAELERKEQKLNQKENGLDKREEELNRREEELNRKEEELKKREQELAKRYPIQNRLDHI